MQFADEECTPWDIFEQPIVGLGAKIEYGYEPACENAKEEYFAD